MKLTDRMDPQSMKNQLESVAATGFENPVINYVVIDGENYVVWGNNRLTAARKLGKTRELLFQEVKLPFRGFRDAADVLAAHIEYLTGSR